MRLRDLIAPEIFPFHLLGFYLLSIFCVRVSAPCLTSTHGNQLWVYEIPEAYLILGNRKELPVERKGLRMNRIRSPRKRTQIIDIQNKSLACLSLEFGSRWRLHCREKKGDGLLAATYRRFGTVFLKQQQDPVVLYGCKTWSLTVREEHKLKVFENRVLRGIFGPKGDEVTGGWRKLHNEELHNLYSSPNIIRIITLRRMRWAGHVACMGEERNVYILLVGEPEGK
jgi:hypothetical protein